MRPDQLTANRTGKVFVHLCVAAELQQRRLDAPHLGAERECEPVVFAAVPDRLH